MASTVYIETTVPSAHVTARTDAGSVHRRTVTQAWWREELKKYEPYTSDNVLAELEEGNWPGKDRHWSSFGRFRAFPSTRRSVPSRNDT